MTLQSVLRAVYPPQCVGCGGLTDAEHALCAPCWRESWFIGGTVCDACGAPLPGAAETDHELCDDCLQAPRPWARGRAVMLYRDVARRLILGLKHGDRTELAKPAGRWMARAAQPLLEDDTVIVPVPLHWTRLLKRRYNQAALLARQVGAQTGHKVLPDALVRNRATAMLENHGREARQAALTGAVRPHQRRGGAVAGRPVLVIDDVLTSGATLAAATDALLAAGARSVSVLVLARTMREP